jgi:hypothetical protein
MTITAGRVLPKFGLEKLCGVIMADAISPQALSDLIGSIYDCALDPSRWDRTLADVRDALDCQGLMLGLNDLRHLIRLLALSRTKWSGSQSISPRSTR